MIKQVVGMICVLITCFGLISCRKLGGPDRATGSFSFEKVQSRSHVSTELGKLVAVTSSGARDDLAQLWFEKPDKTIVVAYVDFISGDLGEYVLVIPRK